MHVEHESVTGFVWLIAASLSCTLSGTFKKICQPNYSKYEIDIPMSLYTNCITFILEIHNGNVKIHCVMPLTPFEYPMHGFHTMRPQQNYRQFSNKSSWKAYCLVWFKSNCISLMRIEMISQYQFRFWSETEQAATHCFDWSRPSSLTKICVILRYPNIYIYLRFPKIFSQNI